MKIYLYYHGGSANHGCEAIVRATKKILDCPLTLYSRLPEQDRKYGIEKIVSLEEDSTSKITRYSGKWLLSAAHSKLSHTDYLHTKFAHNTFFSHIRHGDVCLSIGGDNYCYAGQDILGYYNRILHQRGAKTVLWGCSVEPELIKDEKIAKDLASYDLITARESISYEALKEINRNTVLIPDPAFTLSRIDLPLPPGWVNGRMIGINASPLIFQSTKNASIVFTAYKELIHFILNETEYNIALIPHVVVPDSDDRKPLGELFKYFCDSKRILMLDDCSCEVLKGYIGRCSYFIGARTHATIAAYANCVPTLTIGYSVKSKGIATDLFGSYAHYVLPVNDIISKDAMISAFCWLTEHDKSIRNHLMKVMPEYTSKTYCSKKYIESIL